MTGHDQADSTSEPPSTDATETAPADAQPVDTAGEQHSTEQTQPDPSPRDAAEPQTAAEQDLVGKQSGSEQRRPWFRRPVILIPAIIAALAVVGAAIGIPTAIHLQNVERGDQLAAEFQTALESHRATWSTEALDAAADITISTALPESYDFYALDRAGIEGFLARCQALTTAGAAVPPLLENPVPSLTVEAGADASEAYRAAQVTDTELQTRRDAVTALATEGQESLIALQGFCTALPQYNSVRNAWQLASEQTLQPLYTVDEGEDIDLGNQLVLTCPAEQGCPDYGSEAARLAYADALDATWTTFYRDLSTVAGTSCFLEGFEPVCTVIATEYTKAADANAAAAEALRTGTLPTAAGQALLPEFFAAVEQATAAQDAAEVAIRDAWAAVDPAVQEDTATGWQSRSVQRALAAQETSYTGLIDALR